MIEEKSDSNRAHDGRWFDAEYAETYDENHALVVRRWSLADLSPVNNVAVTTPHDESPTTID
jgi:hypothetical protein